MTNATGEGDDAGRLRGHARGQIVVAPRSAGTVRPEDVPVPIEELERQASARATRSRSPRRSRARTAWLIGPMFGSLS